MSKMKIHKKKHKAEKEQPPTSGTPAFRHTGTAIPTGVNESSDVCPLGEDVFLAVSDVETTANQVSLSGDRKPVPLAGLQPGESGFEGTSYSDSRKRLVVSAEETRKLHFFDWDWRGSSSPKPTHVVTLPLGGEGNKGIEGLAELPAKFSPTGRDQLLLVLERPQTLLMLEADGSGELKKIDLPAGVLAALTDLSGVAVHPLTGHIWICSDESASAVELSISATPEGLSANLLHVEPLKDSKGKALKRVEGIAFTQTGDLLILTENEKVLHRFAKV